MMRVLLLGLALFAFAGAPALAQQNDWSVTNATRFWITVAFQPQWPTKLVGPPRHLPRPIEKNIAAGQRERFQSDMANASLGVNYYGKPLCHVYMVKHGAFRVVSTGSQPTSPCNLQRM